MEEKDLNTYVDNICNEHTFIVRYQELRMVAAHSAREELRKYGLTLRNCKEMLENGYNAPRKRDKDTIEKWFDKSNKTYNVVIGKDLDLINKEEVWVLIHLGKFTRRKIK